MRDRRERNIEKGGREKERGRKRGRKHVEEVRSCLKSWKRLVDAITHTVRACHMALDGSFLLRSRPLFSFIPSSFREETRCFRGRIRVICLIYPVTRDWFNKIYDDIRRKKENFQFLSLKPFTFCFNQFIQHPPFPFFISLILFTVSFETSGKRIVKRMIFQCIFDLLRHIHRQRSYAG